MSQTGNRHRRPRAFHPDDPRLRTGAADIIDPLPPGALEPGFEPAVTPIPRNRRRWRWGAILLSALGGLVAMAAANWLVDLATALMSRQDWLGWLALGLAAVAVLATMVICLREIWSMWGLARLGELRAGAEDAIRNDDAAKAASLAARLRRQYRGRPELSWGLARLREHDGEILDAREALTLVERELIEPLDRQARATVALAARRIAVLTAISPIAVFDMIVVAIQGTRMLQQLAGIYGVRPGLLAMLKLLRQVATHIVLTGGVAIGDDMLQQMIGHRLTAKLSARLGEGMFNGAMTARIGIAAIDLCRPIPFVEARRPRLRDLVADIAKTS